MTSKNPKQQTTQAQVKANMRYLTKSRFKLALECPTKLYYTKKKEYIDKKMDDPFLAALAEGGYQVGELAKCYHSGGFDITSLDYDEAEKQTKELLNLQQEKIILFEPAIKFQNLFIRIDILIKNQKLNLTNNNNKNDNTKDIKFELIEVKAKSFDVSNLEVSNIKSSNSLFEVFLKKDGTILSNWRPYLYDIAFQKYVLSYAYPNTSISSYLMMTDKNAICDVDGLNQKFRIMRDESNRKGVKVSNKLSEEDLKKQLLIKIPVDEIIDTIISDKKFIKMVNEFSDAYANDKKIFSLKQIGSNCAHCEFKATIDDEKNDFKSGFKECWKSAFNWSDADFDDANILEIWNYRKKDSLINNNKIKLKDLVVNDIEPKTSKKNGLSASERQWLQIEKVQKNDLTPFFDKAGISFEMNKWKYPLHFIDFETATVAIPFNKGRRPYESIAFQFSHHVVYQDGHVEHVGQFLETTPGKFPNFDFIRELKRQLEKDEGTIFRYSPHENTILNHIYLQLKNYENSETNETNETNGNNGNNADREGVLDREELCSFIKTITTSTDSSTEKWAGKRSMVDLWDLVKKYYYDPYTHGSNSIKYVLPAILNSSKYLQDKYSKAIYGADDVQLGISKDGAQKNSFQNNFHKNIKSLNFKNWTWIEFEASSLKTGTIEKEVGNNFTVIDPYKKLPKLFTDVSDKNLELISNDNDEIKNGGAALTAYSKMQFSEMSDLERKELSSALLRYCELDTLAMVMIYEAWREWKL